MIANFNPSEIFQKIIAQDFSHRKPPKALNDPSVIFLLDSTETRNKLKLNQGRVTKSGLKPLFILDRLLQN